MGTLALIGLGSNLGDRRANLDAALAALDGSADLILRRASRYYASEPVGGPSGQGGFLNAAAAFETSLDAPALLRRLHEVEAQLGRVREVRWGARTLDLDLLMHGSTRIENPELIVPHPRMALRRFVLAPLAEIAPEVVDPFTGHTVAGLLSNLDRRPGSIALSKSLPYPCEPIVAGLVAKLDAIGLMFEPLERAFGAQFDLENGSDLDPFQRFRLDHQARELHADRWPASLLGDRWIVTDYWLDQTIRESRRVIAELRAGDGLGEFTRSSCRAALTPTFVVAAGGDTWNRQQYDLTRRAGLIGRPREAPPVLRVDPRTGASNPGPNDSDDVQPATGQARLPNGQAWIDLIVAEILAACEASRARVEPA